MNTLFPRSSYLMPLISRRSSRGGQGALALAFLVGGAAILAAVALAFFAASFTNVIFGFHSANRALAAAGAGAEDALIQLARNHDFEGTYEIVVDGDIETEVVVTQSASRAIVTATAGAFGTRRELEVIAGVHPITGEVKVLSWQQATF